MTLKLFELVGADEARPFCRSAGASGWRWRTRGSTAQSIPWRFTEKDAISPYKSEKVPVLLDGDKSVCDSWAIANYLEDAYPDRPSLFGGEGGRAMARMLNWWGDIAVVGGMFPLIVADIFGHLRPAGSGLLPPDRARRGSARRWKRSQAGRDVAVEGFRKGLDPMRLTLKSQPFLGGDAAELRRLHHVRRLPMGARGQPVPAAEAGRPGLRLARKTARRLRRHGAQIRRLPGVARRRRAAILRHFAACIATERSDEADRRSSAGLRRIRMCFGLRSQ